MITTVAGGGGPAGDGGPATASQLGYPIGVVTDSSGDLFIADPGYDLIREVNLATGVITTVAGNGTPGYSGDGGPATTASLDDPWAIAVDSAGHLFIADEDNQRIRMVDLATGIITTVAGNGGCGYYGDGVMPPPPSLTIRPGWRSMLTGICSSPTRATTASARSIFRPE